MTTRKKKTTGLTTAQKVAGAKLAIASSELCLRGDLLTAYQEADTKFREAMALAALSESMAGTPDHLLPLAQAVDAIRQEMADYTIYVKLQAMPPKIWRNHESEHPPRTGEDGGVHEDDRRYGVDVTTFFPAVIPVSVTDPDDMTPEMWADLFDNKLSNGQIADLCEKVWQINQGRVAVPFSPAVSKILSHFGK